MSNLIRHLKIERKSRVISCTSIWCSDASLGILLQMQPIVLGRVDGNSSYNSMGDNWGSHRSAQVKLEFFVNIHILTI